MTRREQERRECCTWKIRHVSWDEAERASLAVWLENPRPTDANPPTPYLCDQPGERHYHVGHLKFGQASA